MTEEVFSCVGAGAFWCSVEDVSTTALSEAEPTRECGGRSVVLRDNIVCLILGEGDV